MDALNNKKKKSKRQWRIYWFNPPWDMNVATKVGKKFFQILDETIPPGHPLHKVFNRKTVKLSYSTMPNMLKKISAHNSKVTASAIAESAMILLYLPKWKKFNTWKPINALIVKMNVMDILLKL